MSAAARHTFWKHTRRWSIGLLLVWLAINLVVPWFARDLDRYSFLGFPLGYWLAAEGALFVYLLLIVVYVVVMDRLEAGFEAGADAAGPEAAVAASGAPQGER